MAMFIFVPTVLAAVTLLVSDRASRYTSLIGGSLVGLLGVYAVGSHLAAGEVNGHVLLAALTGVLAFLIAGLGAAGLRQPAPPAPRARERSRPRAGAAV